MLKFLQIAKILKIIQLVLTPPRLFHWMSFIIGSFMLGSLGVINAIFKPTDSLNKLLFTGSLLCLMIAIGWRTNQPPFTWGNFSLSPLLSTIFISIILYNNLPDKLQDTAVIFIPILYLCLTLLYEVFRKKGKVNGLNLINPTFIIYLLSSFLFSSWLAMHFLVNDWLEEYPSFLQQNMDNSNFVIKLDAIRGNSKNQSSPSPLQQQLPNNQGINNQVFNSQSFTNQSNNLSGNILSTNQLTSQLPNHSSNNDVNQYFGAKILKELEIELRKELAEQQDLLKSVDFIKSRIISNFDKVKKKLSDFKEIKFWELAPSEVKPSPVNLSYDVVLKLRWKGPKLEENDFYLTKKCTIQSTLKSFINQQNTVGAIHELPLLDWDENFYSNNSDINKFKRNNLYKFTLVSQARKPPVLGPGCLDPNQPITDQHGKLIPESQLKRSLSHCEKPIKPIPKTHIPQHKPLPQNHRPVNEFTAYCSNPNISDLSKKLRRCPQFASPYNSHNNAEKLKKIYSGWNNQDLPRQDINNNVNNNSRLNNPNNLPGINNPNNPNNLPGINNQNRGNFNRPNPPNNPSNNQTNKEPLSLTFPRLPKFIKDFIDFLNDYFQIDQPNNNRNRTSPNNNSNSTNPNNLNNNSRIGNNPNDNLALPINTNIIKCEPIKKEIIPNSEANR